jgi:hypothetical protein
MVALKSSTIGLIWLSQVRWRFAVATANRVTRRTKLVARPKSEAAVKEIRAEATERYSKTLEYLGRCSVG